MRDFAFFLLRVIYIRMNPEPKPLGMEAIRAALADMPARPGVYRMLDTEGTVLYVGKAKQLKHRVASYTNASRLTCRILRMVNQVASVEITVTGSEAEALLLEASQIKKLRPRYNILLKDDKSFPYIHIEGGHDFPRIRKHRGAQKKPGEYFGPFASAGAVNETLAILQKAFLLRPCSDSVFANRSRPCLQYQIRRCSAPCVGYISQNDYAASIAEARAFLQGKSRAVQERFARQMQAHSEAMEYEQAAALRDRIRALTQIQQEQASQPAGLENADLLALHRRDGACVIQAVFYRGGHAFGHQAYFPRQTDQRSEAEILEAFIGQFYQSHTPPPLVLVNRVLAEPGLLSEALSLRAGRQVKLLHPQRGARRELMRQGETNARLALEQHLNARMSERRQLEAVARIFGMDETPARIEVYDNSHIMGRYALGGMIVATPEGFDKKAYRRFNIRDLKTEPGDDYAMMREVFTRRFGRLLREDPKRAQGNWPDLVLIDGGQGQLNAVSQIFADLGVTGLCYAAIAKGPQRHAGRETFFLPEREPFTLPPGDPALHYLQRLRDEAHRFAIGSHRSRRARSLTQSALEDIPGIGATRKRALLNHFGSKQAVENATLAELEKVHGINKTVARLVHDYFRPDAN